MCTVAKASEAGGLDGFGHDQRDVVVLLVGLKIQVEAPGAASIVRAFIQASYANRNKRRESKVKVQEEVEMFRRRERVGKP